MSEIWKPVVGFPDYQVSNLGRIKGKICMFSHDAYKNDYVRVQLNRDGKPYSRLVHRIVMAAFVGEPEDKVVEVAHINGIKNDNRLENLMYASRYENAQHKKHHGTIPFGQSNRRALLTDNQAAAIRLIYKGLTTKQKGMLPKLFNVDLTSIKRAASGKTFSHIDVQVINRNTREERFEEWHKSFCVPAAPVATTEGETR